MFEVNASVACARIGAVSRHDGALCQAMPWIGDGPIYACNQRSADALRAGLRGLGLELVELEGERIVNQDSFATLFKQAFGFPTDTGTTWDALSGVPPEALALPPAERVAIVWHRADHSASFALKVVVEAGGFILRWSEDLARSDAVPTEQVALFLLGMTRDFNVAPVGWKPEAAR